MNCQEVIDLMQRQLDNDLDENEYEVLMNHTRHCPDCSAMFDRLQMLSSELAGLPKAVPSYSLVDAILPQLELIEMQERKETETTVLAADESREALPARRSSATRRWPSMRMMGGVVAAAIVAGLFIVSYNSGFGPSLSGNGSANSSANEATEGSAFVAEEGLVTKMQSDAAANQEAEPDVSSESLNDKDVGSEPASRSADDPEAYGISGKSEAPDQPGEGTNGMDIAVTNNSGEEETVPSEGETGGSNQDESKQEIAKTDSLSSIGSPAAAAVVSHSGELQALADNFKITIVNAADGALVFETDRKNGKLAGLVWSDDDGKLQYEVQLEQGAIEQYVIDVKAGSDTKIQH